MNKVREATLPLHPKLCSLIPSLIRRSLSTSIEHFFIWIILTYFCFSHHPLRNGQNWIVGEAETTTEVSCPSSALLCCMTLRHIPSLIISVFNIQMCEQADFLK